MDLAVYISELLGLQGEVSVPGIGYFSQIRINGYYNEAENKFYPPAHEVNFEPNAEENDSLAKYIANKKNISLASSKYFIDKYVIGIKQQVASKNVEINGLGYLYSNGEVLAFKASNFTGASDPFFYGFPPVNIPQADESPVIEYIPPAEEKEVPPEVPVEEETKFEAVPEPVPTIIPAEPVSEEEAQLEEVQEYEYEEPASGRGNLWIPLLLIIIIILLAILGLYKYKPAWFDRSAEKSPSFVAVNADSNKNVPNTDTSKTAVLQDSSAKTVSSTVNPSEQKINAIDSTKSRFELMAGSFKTQKAADMAIKNYKGLGVDAKVVTDAPGKRIQLSIGTFRTKSEADKARIELIKTKKVSKDIYPLEINPKK